MTKPGRPPVLKGRTHRLRLPNCGSLFLTINCDNPLPGIAPLPREIFIHLGKAGGCQTALLNGIARLASLALQAGVPSGAVAGALEKLACPFPIAHSDGLAPSCMDLIGQEIERKD